MDPTQLLERRYHVMPDGSMEHLFDADRASHPHVWRNNTHARDRILIIDGEMWDQEYTAPDIWATR